VQDVAVSQNQNLIIDPGEFWNKPDHFVFRTRKAPMRLISAKYWWTVFGRPLDRFTIETRCTTCNGIILTVGLQYMIMTRNCPSCCRGW
jgi:hypothetical protein